MVNRVRCASKNNLTIFRDSRIEYGKRSLQQLLELSFRTRSVNIDIHQRVEKWRDIILYETPDLYSFAHHTK